jgi:hypothetical protein
VAGGDGNGDGDGDSAFEQEELAREYMLKAVRKDGGDGNGDGDGG